MKTCPRCGNQNLDMAKFCDGCGAPLEGIASGPPGVSVPVAEGPQHPVYAMRPQEPGQGMTSGGKAVLRSTTTGETFVLEPGKEVVIGRGDPARGLYPDVSLSDSAALSQGVSRLHAKIIHQAGTYYLVDLNSTNSTYINGRRLTPQQFYSLRDGDVIELGKYRMLFNFL